jgi:hypothetical protein
LPPLAEEGDDGEVAVWPAGGRINNEVERSAPRERRRGGVHERINVHRAKALLQRIKRQSGQLRLDQVGSVRHHGLEALVPRRRLPLWNQVQHVLALRRQPRLPARDAGERYLHRSGARKRVPLSLIIYCEKLHQN